MQLQAADLEPAIGFWYPEARIVPGLARTRQPDSKCSMCLADLFCLSPKEVTISSIFAGSIRCACVIMGALHALLISRYPGLDILVLCSHSHAGAAPSQGHLCKVTAVVGALDSKALIKSILANSSTKQR